MTDGRDGHDGSGDPFDEVPRTVGEIVLLAEQLDCGLPHVALRFALMIVSQCAELAAELGPEASAQQASDAIRDAFRAPAAANLNT